MRRVTDKEEKVKSHLKVCLDILDNKCGCDRPTQIYRYLDNSIPIICHTCHLQGHKSIVVGLIDIVIALKSYKDILAMVK